MKNNILKGLKKLTGYLFNTYSIEPDFEGVTGYLKENDLKPEECLRRKDFRGEKAFTIDCAECKDMDDAVSIIKTSIGYRLGVHIADVATYIPFGSELDEIANDRATSIYLPHRTVPMLPKVLTNDCCSLNPGVERYTLSVIIHIDFKGKIKRTEITKGKIKSRVKGIYSEVNQIFDGTADKNVIKKYEKVYDDLFVMSELYKVLRDKRIRLGANTEDSDKPKISVSKDHVELIPNKEGIAENMIEEFMIITNQVVAEYLYNNDLPAVYRIQEEKNDMAAYVPVKSHHADMALESYTHFTSPIRRVADLKNHQILTMHLNGVSNKCIHDMFDEILPDICERATKRSRTVRQIQENCEKYCYEQFFMLHKDNKYEGEVTGFNCKNQPIVKVKNYNINVIGYALINVTIGDNYSFNVSVSHSNKLFACNPKKLAA
ncbi:MAG: RNB domain-containing ribonuclease [Lachnospiraceae bacterium]|nr:RNB domain-containing ribonuclease [Lachnospiraceae bacterium]